MADVIQDVGVFNVKDELVFVDEAFSLSLNEEEVICGPDENYCEYNATGGYSYTSVLKGSIPGVICKLETHQSSNLNPDVEDHVTTTRITDESEDISSVDLAISSISEEGRLHDDTATGVNDNEPLLQPHDHLAWNLDNHSIEVKVEDNGKRVWACKQCDKTFISRKGSVIHLRTHTGERPFTCQVCKKRFIDSSTLMKHQVIHQATRPFICSVCLRGFNQKVALQRHESTHSLQPLFTCRYCPKTFLVRSSLHAHENIHSRIKPYVCGFCPSRFHTLTLQKQHERVHTNERPYQCSFCPKAFKDSGTLFKHQVIHSGVKPYCCPLCSNGFTQKVAVRKHLRTHVLKATSKQCPICKVTIFNPDELCFHLEKHVLENPRLAKPLTKPPIEEAIQLTPNLTKPIESDLSDLATLCDVAISTSGNFFPERMDLNPSRGRFYCFYCGMRYKQERALNSHLTGVHLLCLLCSTKFYDRKDLDSHNCAGKSLKNSGIGCKPKSKQGSKQFYCEKCSKSFSSRNGFVIHQRSHTGERPYGCRWCDKAFGDSATRHKHERIHTGERPFKCLSCPRAFNQRAALRAHQVTHSCNRAFMCKHCPSSFPYATTLRKHVEACHSDALEVTCPLCAKVLSDASALHEHIQEVHVVEGEAYVCTLCDSGVFTQGGEYCDHMVWHAKQHILDFYVKSKKRKQSKGLIMNKRAFNVRKYSID